MLPSDTVSTVKERVRFWISKRDGNCKLSGGNKVDDKWQP